MPQNTVTIESSTVDSTSVGNKKPTFLEVVELCAGPEKAAAMAKRKGGAELRRLFWEDLERLIRGLVRVFDRKKFEVPAWARAAVSVKAANYAAAEHDLSGPGR